jgi:aryl carrier-like protein
MRDRAASSCEDAVAAVWERLLGVPAIDRDEGFFDLGADSILVVRAVGLLRGRWPDLKVVDVFAHPTVSSLASHLAGGE